MSIDLTNVPAKRTRTMAQIEDQVRTVTTPEGTQFYEVAGHVLFPCYGYSGGLENAGFSILYNTDAPPFHGMDRGRGGPQGCQDRKWYVIEFNMYDDWHDANAKFKAAFEYLRPKDVN